MAETTENSPENSMEKENPEHNPILHNHFLTVTGQQAMVSSVSEPMGRTGI